MSSHTTGTADRTDYDTDERATERGPPSGVLGRLRGVATRGNRLGTAAMLAGGAMLASAIRSQSGRRRIATAATGVALIGVGVVQRVAPERLPTGGEGDAESATGDDGDEHPRGTIDEPNVQTETEPDQGHIQFTEHQDEEPGAKPDLDDEDAPHDPRVDSEGDEVTIDLSEAAMADEASEAAGPTSGQSLPTQTDATEPEDTPTEDAGASQVDDAEPSMDDADESDETAGDAEESGDDTDEFTGDADDGYGGDADDADDGHGGEVGVIDGDDVEAALGGDDAETPEDPETADEDYEVGEGGEDEDEFESADELNDLTPDDEDVDDQ